MHDYTVISIEGAYGTSLAMTMDILAAAAALAPRHGAPAPRWRLCSIGGGEVVLQSGLRIHTAKLAARSRSDRSVWILPGLGLNTPDEIRHRADQPDVRALIEALKAHAKRGGTIAAACSSVFLLHFAGLIQGKRVTTSWWLAPALERMRSGARVHAERMVCADSGVITGGAAFAQTDLMLHLLRSSCGPRTVDAISRFLLVDAREAQASYVVPEVLANGDALIARIVSRIEAALPDTPAVADLARELRVSQRTLTRLVQRITGKSTLALLQSVRLNRARVLLEQSRMSVEQVAAAVGYSDATALRRLMKKLAGSKPSHYRPAMGC